jgi:sodium/bile acid cotransporter 7
LVLALFLAHVLCGCGQPPGDDASRAARVAEMYMGYKAKDFPRIRDLSGSEVLALAKDRPVVLVDVREPYERAVSTLPGAMSEEAFLARRADMANATVVAYCTIGYRSGMFVRGMAHLNATVYNLRGGVLGWLHAGGNLTDPTGQPSLRVHVYGSTWNLAPLRYQAVW